MSCRLAISLLILCRGPLRTAESLADGAPDCVSTFSENVGSFLVKYSFTCIIPPGSSSVWQVSRSPLKLPFSCKITNESNAPAVTSRCSGTGKTEVKWISNYTILSLFTLMLWTTRLFKATSSALIISSIPLR